MFPKWKGGHNFFELKFVGVDNFLLVDSVDVYHAPLE